MSDGKARIEASLDGSGQVASEAKKIEGSLTGAASKIESKLGGALKSVTGALGSVVSGGLQAAGVFQSINLAKAVEDVKRLDQLTGQLSARTGASSGQLEAAFGKLQGRILQSNVAQAEFAKSLGGVTYDAKFAVEALDGIGTHALASGRDLGEDLPIARALQGLGVDGKDAQSELDRVRAIAEKVGATGGHLALQDSLGNLHGVLQGVATDSDAARGKLEGLLAVLGKGQKSPERADQVRSAALGAVKSRALDIERATGRQVLDDNGNLIDPTQSLKDLQALTTRKFGGNKAAARRALISDFGADAGLAIYRGGFDAVDGLAGLKGSGATAKDAERAKQDEANKRRAKELEKESAAQGIGRTLLGVDSALTDVLGAKGATVVETFAGLGGLGAAKGVGAKVAAGAVGGGALLPAAAGAAALGAAGGVLYDIGEDTETTGRKYRDSHAATIGAELARRAQERGGFDPADFDQSKGQGQAAMVEMLKVLSERKDQLSPDFAAQVAAALASELRRAPITIRPEQPANQPGGN